MKAEEKAKELVDSYKVVLTGYEDYAYLHETTWNDMAKQSALICVNEILRIEKQYIPNPMVNYWNDVKKEIEKL